MAATRLVVFHIFHCFTVPKKQKIHLHLTVRPDVVSALFRCTTVMDCSDDRENPAGHNIDRSSYAIPIKLIFYHIRLLILAAKVLLFFDIRCIFANFRQILVVYMINLSFYS